MVKYFFYNLNILSFFWFCEKNYHGNKKEEIFTFFYYLWVNKTIIVNNMFEVGTCNKFRTYDSDKESVVNLLWLKILHVNQNEKKRRNLNIISSCRVANQIFEKFTDQFFFFIIRGFRFGWFLKKEKNFLFLFQCLWGKVLMVKKYFANLIGDFLYVLFP